MVGFVRVVVCVVVIVFRPVLVRVAVFVPVTVSRPVLVSVL
jgi:hypothetical protein